MVRVPSKSGFGNLSDSSSKSDKSKRELARIRESPTFRLGVIFTNAIEKPWRLIWLPLSIFSLLVSLVRERTGKKSLFSDKLTLGGNGGKRNSIIMFPTNGVGFGHFTRMLAVAKRMRRLDPKIDIVFFTTMPTLHILQREGFPAYFLPGRKKIEGMDASTWNSISEELLANVISIHNPKAFIFDGSYPYRGMLNAIKRRPEILKIWMRRGTFKIGKSNVPVDSFEHFDLLVSPNDSIKDVQNADFQIPLVHCDPIILLDHEDLLPGNVLRRRLGIPEDAVVGFVQLGAGQINDIFSDISLVVQSIIELGGFVVLAESLIGNRVELENFENIRVIRDYPTSQYYHSFDFAVIAGGYNSYHESINFSLPSICIPNSKTGMDDQSKRAGAAEKIGAMLVVENCTRPKMLTALEKIMNPDKRAQMKESCNELRTPNGADQIAAHILDLINRID